MENQFGKEFWFNYLKELGYPINEVDIPVDFLREKRATPPGVNPKRCFQLYSDPLTFDLIILEFDKLPSRGVATKVSRYWRSNQGGRQLIIFEDGVDSYAVVLPGAVEESLSKTRILSISYKIYHTDQDALNSLRFIPDKKKLREAYDKDFLPYEKLREEFFEHYRNAYQEIYGITKDLMGSNASSYSQRFLGRLMFLYFLQKKGWLRGNKKFIDTIKDYKELNWVFYKALSTEGNEGFPYLDGTLFEREEYFTPSIEKSLQDKMDSVFLKVRELFNRYNFTIDELSPNDVEVSIDPAMIGTIFENMLPENERGQKGTFYTPIEEISFICRRALSNYLGLSEQIVTENGKQILKDGIENLIESIEKDKSGKRARVIELEDKLLNIKILDPAVGSGGFLLGMMQEIIEILKKLDESVKWESHIDYYKDKILHNLFGFDIEGEAIEIARLRLWLSIIIDKKDPNALQNLDMNLLEIGDSLSPGTQLRLSEKSREISERINYIRDKFWNATSPTMRVKLRKQKKEIDKELEKETGIKGGTIESWLTDKVDIIIMNPPYVRQEHIQKEKKEYYASEYGVSLRSDYFVYFILRSLQLIKDNGIVSVISSDKWLEADYGLDLQKKISDNLIAVYGQRERTFKAMVNSIIFVYSKTQDSSANTDFVYLESYVSGIVRNHIKIKRVNLIPGKWFYLRLPELFMKEVMPKLTKKLGDFTEIKMGIKTGADHFFYMKDISSEYEVDYLSNPSKFEDLNIKAKNEAELNDQGLIYIKNGDKDKFVINKEDTKPIIKSAKELKKYIIIDKPNTLCLYTKNPGIMTKKYIEYGTKHLVNDKEHKEQVIGYNKRPSFSKRKIWYSINNLEPANIILPKFVMDRFFIPLSIEPIICNNTFYTLKYVPKSVESKIKVLPYLNSVVFYIIMELYMRRQGGGVGEIMESDYKQMPVPDFSLFNFKKDMLIDREVKPYLDEVKMKDRQALDEYILKVLGVDISLKQLYDEFVELVKDRLVKSGRSESKANKNE